MICSSESGDEYHDGDDHGNMTTHNNFIKFMDEEFNKLNLATQVNKFKWKVSGTLREAVG